MTLIGLAALYDIADKSHAAISLRPALQTRALLGLVYRASNGDRRPYDDLWRTLLSEPRSSQPGYARSTLATTHCHRIARTLGVEPAGEVWQEIHKVIARHSYAPAKDRLHKQMAGEIYLAQLEQEIIATKGRPHSPEACALVAARVASGRPVQGG